MGKGQNGIYHQSGFFQRLSHSIFPVILRGVKDQELYRRYLNTFILHFRPRNVPEPTLQFTLTWGLGGMASVLVILLIGTGLLLKFFYIPSPEKAYESVLYLQNAVLFGRFIRNIHHWSANLLLVVVFLHFMRVFFTGAFHPPRQFNWVIGLGLFFTVLLSKFTGYLLLWDQLSFWAVTIKYRHAGIHTGGRAMAPGIDTGRNRGWTWYFVQFLCHSHGCPSDFLDLFSIVSFLAYTKGRRCCCSTRA